MMERENSLSGVVMVAKDSLGLYINDCVALLQPIANWVYNVDRSDMVDILFRTGVYDSGDFSCGEINERGRNFLREVGVRTEDKANWAYWYSLALLDTSDVLNQLTCKDIYDMAVTRRMLN